MVITKRARRKRRRRRIASHSRSDDEVDDPNPIEYVWFPLTGISLLLLAISFVLGALGSAVDDVFLTLYALCCLPLFAGTTSYLAQIVSQDVKDGSRNSHLYRKQTFRDAVRGAANWVFLGWVLYVPSIVIPALVFRKDWLTYLAVLIVISWLFSGVYGVIRWWWYHTVKSE